MYSALAARAPRVRARVLARRAASTVTVTGMVDEHVSRLVAAQAAFCLLDQVSAQSWAPFESRRRHQRRARCSEPECAGTARRYGFVSPLL